MMSMITLQGIQINVARVRQANPSRSLQQGFEFVDPREVFAHVGFEHTPEFEDVPREGYTNIAASS